MARLEAVRQRRPVEEVCWSRRGALGSQVHLPEEGLVLHLSVAVLIGRRQRDADCATEAGREDVRRGGVVAEPVRVEGGLEAHHHEVVAEDLPDGGHADGAEVQRVQRLQLHTHRGRRDGRRG